LPILLRSSRIAKDLLWTEMDEGSRGRGGGFGLRDLLDCSVAILRFQITIALISSRARPLTHSGLPAHSSAPLRPPCSHLQAIWGPGFQLACRSF